MQAIQALLVALALGVTTLRCWVRLRFERRGLTISDWLTCIGWLFVLGWFICSTIALQILLSHPPTGSRMLVDSVAYLKVSNRYNSQCLREKILS